MHYGLEDVWGVHVSYHKGIHCVYKTLIELNGRFWYNDMIGDVVVVLMMLVSADYVIRTFCSHMWQGV